MFSLIQLHELRVSWKRELRDALNSPLQLTGLKLAVFAAPIKGPSQKATVARR